MIKLLSFIEGCLNLCPRGLRSETFMSLNKLKLFSKVCVCVKGNGKMLTNLTGVYMDIQCTVFSIFCMCLKMHNKFLIF